MKRFFLIPLLTLMCSVMAWGEAIEVSTLTQLQAAVPESGSVDIKLMADIVDASEGVVAIGDNKALLFVPNGVTVNLDMNGHKIHSTYPEAGSSAPSTIAVMQGVLNFSNSSSDVAEVISENDYAFACVYWGASTITGNIDFGAIQCVFGEITIDDNFIGHVSQIENQIGTITIRNGQYAFNPENYLPNNYGVVEDNGTWTVVEGLFVPRVRIVGGNEYTSLQDAFADVEGTATIQLLKDISVDYSDIELGENSLSEVDGIIKVLNGQDITLDLNSHNITMDYFHQSDDGIALINIFDGGKLTVIGEGTFTTSNEWSFVELMDNGPESHVFAIESEADSHLVLAGGTYYSWEEPEYDILAENKTFVTAGENDELLKVVDSGSVVYVAQIGERKYTSLQVAINSAWSNDVIELLADVDEDIAITKIAKIQYGEYDATRITAGDGYSVLDNGVVLSFMPTSVYGLYDFLTKPGEASFTVKENTDISALGSITVNGTKTLTINEGVSVLYKRQGELANIVVAGGAKLTILGSGSFAPIPGESLRSINGNRAIDVDGELVVGVKDDANNQPHFVTTSLYRGSAVTVNATGVATFNNADIQAAHMVINNFGTTTINGGEYVSSSTTQNGYSSAAYTYAVQNYNKMTINGGHIKGVQGALACQNKHSYDELNNDQFEDVSVATINGGSFETVYGHNAKTDEDNTQDNYYALYVSNYAVVNIFGGEFKVQTPNAGGNRVVLVGDNDAYNTFGIINIYGGKYQQKVLVSKARKEQSSYPASIPVTSQWYSAFQEADADKAYAPLPAGYEYFEIIGSGTPEDGQEVDADAYAAGYRWKVICTNDDTKEVEVDDPDATIPWQQNSTWASNEVPEETTIVTIPVDATVIVKADLSGDAVAEQVFVNQGAKLTVESGKTLSIGDGGMNIANGGSITVEPGAVVKIGTAGVITTEKDALVLVSNDDQQAALLYDPTVPQSENTQPKATVKLETKSKQIGDQSYVYERFAIPTLDGAETIYKIEGGIPKTAGKPNETVALYNDAPSFLQAVWAWDNNAGEWSQLNSMLQMKPFVGYQLTNNTANGGLVYVFEGNLVGNNNGTYEFVEDGFHFFGNSYSAEINIKKFLNNLASGAEKSVWLYDPYDKTFKVVTYMTSNGRVKYGDAAKTPMTDIRSMQAFIMMLNDGTDATVDYASAIWGNPKYNPSASPAPARERETVAEDWATIKVASANGLKDEFTLVQSEEFSSAFENGADASKFMNKENINLYATTNAGNLAMVATDNIDRTVLAFAAGEATEYTISFEGVEGNEFTLRDIVTGTMVAMKEGATYTFTQEANTTNAARFEIIGIAKTPTAIENVEAEAKTHGIYTIAGQFVGNDFNALSAGVYVVNGIKIVK